MVVPAPLWRTSPARLVRLVVGLTVFGVGDALIVRSALGNSPWTVFAEGLSLHSPLSIGGASILIGLVLFAIWVPLRVRPGLGTVLNVFLIGLAIDATLAVTAEPSSLLVRRWSSCWVASRWSAWDRACTWGPSTARIRATA